MTDSQYARSLQEEENKSIYGLPKDWKDQSMASVSVSVEQRQKPDFNKMDESALVEAIRSKFNRYGRNKKCGGSLYPCPKPGTGEGMPITSTARVKISCNCEPHVECVAMRVQEGEKECGSHKKDCHPGLLGNRKYKKKDLAAVLNAIWNDEKLRENLADI